MSTTTTIPATLAVLIQDHTYAGYRFLYCHACHSIVFQAGLLRHLQRLHRTLPHSQRKLIRDQFAALSDIISQSDHARLPLPPDRSLPLPCLPTYSGLACGRHRCRFLSRSYDCLRQHLNADHAIYRDACAPFIHQVSLQRWHSSTRARYWIAGSEQRPAGEREVKRRTTGGRRSDQLHALEALQAQEQRRLLRLEQGNVTAEAGRREADSGTTPWLEYTQWPEQFAGRPLDILAATAVLPARECTADYVLGAWQGHDFISPVEDEARLCRLVQAVDAVFQRCLDTLETVPQLLRCWLKTFTLQGFYPKPFKPLARLTTLHRYKRHWKQFLCFAFRA